MTFTMRSGNPDNFKTFGAACARLRRRPFGRRPGRAAALAASLALGVLLPRAALAFPVTNVFQMQEAFPAHLRLVSELRQSIEAADYARMEAVCSNAAALFPADAVWRYNLACAQTRQGRLEEARASLAAAADLGFADERGLSSDDDLALLRRDPAFRHALERVRDNAAHPGRTPGAISSLPVSDVAWVTTTNTAWDMNAGGFRVFLSPPAGVPARRTTSIPGQTGALLRKWLAEGTAAGNYGDLYDNHDRGHSALETPVFTGLAQTRYCAEAHAAGVDTGFALFDFQGRPAIGNSSTANVSGPFWGSCARKLQNAFVQNLLVQYLSNVLYVYPQHHDYLASGLGDVFPTRTPYLFIAPGSSWTDKPILASLATALAAMRPEVKEALAAAGRIAPTLQYLLRASQTNVASRADYLKPLAHPVVFDGLAVDTARLAKLAHSLSTNALPPVATLRVFGDDSVHFLPFRDYPDPRGERLYDSPFAVARVWRAPAYTRTMALEAGEPGGGGGVRYHWFVGQGDPAKVRIREIDLAGRRVEIAVDYHAPPFATPFGVKSSRVDVLCVADDGVNYSAPSFVTWYFPQNERRTYAPDGRPLAIDYAAGATNYADPDLVFPNDFRVEFDYGPDGAPAGVRRIQGDGAEASAAP